ncbi:DUF4190 domain-containing protein [Gulosibacter sp. ACHW.36C]|uniref:DUF4190 domain-containing protein n=1 Tax=Gulosibacter sediminis TaxID=1729695 RepID=A0ABY4MWQ4_9MICO|nr:DUF4190 domain-containing protein [Gulosibacter sediminis]UQN14799.1 DUF4190 domain-containing protein [Gulosibacter sediminis]
MTNTPENPYENPYEQPNPYAQQPPQPQPVPPQQPYQQPYPAYASGPLPPQPTGEFNVMGLVALICGIIAIGVSWVPFLGWFGMLPALAAVGFGIAGVAAQRYTGNRGLAIAGLILGGVGFILCLILPIFTGAWFVFAQVISYDSSLGL